MRLSDYSFGRVKVDGNTKSSDFILHRDWLHDWWRESGHRVIPADLEKIIAREPDFIVFGEGANSRMSLTSSAKKLLKEQKIDFKSLPTARAVKKFNELDDEGVDAAAALHLTC